jgi:hypothetical protein
MILLFVLFIIIVYFVAPQGTQAAPMLFFSISPIIHHLDYNAKFWWKYKKTAFFQRIGLFKI